MATVRCSFFVFAGFILLLLPALFMLSGCGRGGGGEDGATLASITVTPANPSMTLGAAQQFAAMGTYTDGATQVLTTLVTWSSSTAGVAAINSSGLAAGVSVGAATITAALGSISGSTTLTVTTPALVSIAVTPANPVIAMGLTQQFTATGTYTDGTTQVLTTLATWNSSAAGAATINSSGLAAGVSVGAATITAVLGGIQDSTSLTVVPSGSGLPVSVSGIVEYEDQTYDSNGFTGTVLKPVRKAVVEAVRNGDGKVLTSGATGLDGSYSLTFTNTGTAGVYVRVKALVSDNTVIVKNNSGALYSIASPALDDSTATSFSVDLTATVATGGGIFNILDVLLTGAEFVTGLAGAPPVATALWASGSCDGTYFDSTDNTIHILGGCSGDTDEYDDPVLLHEYGHLIAAHFSRDDSPGGIHYLNDNTQDIRLSWSEGWGDFFSSAARNDPLYVDTVGSAANISFSLEDLSTVMGFDLAAVAIYTTNEISVAAVLWDVFDTTPSESYVNVVGTDAVSAGMTPIWDVIANYFTCAVCGITNVSVEDFWDGWFARGYGLLADMEILAADRKMALTVDSFESDDTAGTAQPIAVNGSAQTHTLYPINDLDYVSFFATSGTQYTVQTSGLTNGADTFLEVFGTDGITLIRSNDDATAVSKSGNCGVSSACPPNDATTLASKVIFSPSVGGTYYARVKRSSSAPPSAGMDGGYQIMVTSP